MCVCWQWTRTHPDGLLRFEPENNDSKFEGVFPLDMSTPGFTKQNDRKEAKQDRIVTSEKNLRRTIQNVQDTLYLKCTWRLISVRAAYTSPSSTIQESYFQAQCPGAFANFHLELSALYFKNSLQSETEILIYFSTPKLLLSQHNIEHFWTKGFLRLAVVQASPKLTKGKVSYSQKKKVMSILSWKKDPFPLYCWIMYKISSDFIFDH